MSENSMTWICFLPPATLVSGYLTFQRWKQSCIDGPGADWPVWELYTDIMCSKTIKSLSPNWEIAFSRTWACQGRAAETLLIRVHFQDLPCGRGCWWCRVNPKWATVNAWGYCGASFGAARLSVESCAPWTKTRYSCVSTSRSHCI